MGLSEKKVVVLCLPFLVIVVIGTACNTSGNATLHDRNDTASADAPVPDDTGSPDSRADDIQSPVEDTPWAPPDTSQAEDDTSLPDTVVELDTTPDTGAADTGAPDVPPPPCPADMVELTDVCMDRYEAPNTEGEVPLVMYHLVESEAWCQSRGKRLCFDDEWQRACEGPNATLYPYGSTHNPGVCNDDKIWRVYSQSRLSNWPSQAAGADVATLDELFTRARGLGAAAADSADHVEALYQGDKAGDNPGCTNAYGVYDLQGNVEEWTKRRDGGTTDFTGNLKGRYWAEVRTCQSNVRSHGDFFRFYEIGFRCCADPGSLP